MIIINKHNRINSNNARNNDIKDYGINDDSAIINIIMIIMIIIIIIIIIIIVIIIMIIIIIIIMIVIIMILTIISVMIIIITTTISKNNFKNIPKEFSLLNNTCCFGIVRIQIRMTFLSFLIVS